MREDKASLNVLNVLSSESEIDIAVSSGEDIAAPWIVEWSTLDILPSGNAFKSKAVGIQTLVHSENVLRNWIAEDDELISTLQIAIKDNCPLLCSEGSFREKSKVCWRWPRRLL